SPARIICATLGMARMRFTKRLARIKKAGCFFTAPRFFSALWAGGEWRSDSAGSGIEFLLRV
ncbi:hypothetical protein, partial [Escherichia coli]|uniref:hypothetical protein n=1 Tax=Escherichia coli TaxID=562 RepID=UPI001BC8BE3B